MDDYSSLETKDPRHLSRLLAAQFLFTRAKSINSSKNLNFYESNTLLSIYNQKKYDNKLYEAIIEGVEECEKELDETIKRLAPAWPIDQINLVDLIILRIAIWESNFYNKTPYKVAINEAIEITKILSSEASAKFINGVLGTLIKEKQEKDGK